MSEKNPVNQAIISAADFSEAITKGDKEYIRVLEANHRIKTENLDKLKYDLARITKERDQAVNTLNLNAAVTGELEADVRRLKEKQDELKGLLVKEIDMLTQKAEQYKKIMDGKSNESDKYFFEGKAHAFECEAKRLKHMLNFIFKSKEPSQNGEG